MEKIEKSFREHDSRPDSDWGVKTVEGFNINSNYNKRSWTVDNFWEDPYKVREYALSQVYWDKDHGGVGWRTRKQFSLPGVKEKFESIMDMKITNWMETYSICGVFQAGYAGTPNVYHMDSQKYAAMIYLTPDAPYQAGTKVVANKKTRLFHISQSDNLSDFFPNQETFTDGTLFEDIDVFGNVFNRLVIFDSKCIHTACDYFGHSINTGRLWQMYFFDAE